MISNEALQDFKKIWQAEVGADISDTEAMEQALALLVVFDFTYRPLKREWEGD